MSVWCFSPLSCLSRPEQGQRSEAQRLGEGLGEAAARGEVSRQQYDTHSQEARCWTAAAVPR